jgi:Uncharacterized protein conserved in bacteria
MYRFDETEIRRQVSQLADWQRVAFMASCCERMLPNFSQFVADVGCGSAEPLRRALDTTWEWVTTAAVPIDLVELREACERLAPDTGRFKSPLTSAALDAANATAAVLDSLESNDAEKAVEVASLARDTVDLYVQALLNLDPGDVGFESKILSHPLMQSELARQHEDLMYLRTIGRERFAEAGKVRQKWANSVRGSLGQLGEPRH